MTLLATVERHLRRSEQSPSRFGRDVIGDPRFVFDLRRGREPRAATAARVLAAIAGGVAAVDGKSAPSADASDSIDNDVPGKPRRAAAAVAMARTRDRRLPASPACGGPALGQR